MWEGEYQSEMCWEFSELMTTPCHSLIVPHLQIGSRPMASRIAAWSAISPRQMTRTWARVNFIGRASLHQDSGRRLGFFDRSTLWG